MALSAARGPELPGWVPFRVDWRTSPPVVHWCQLGRRRFEEPFFEQTVGAALRDPATLLLQHRTPIDVLSDFAPPRFGPEPSGFVFHLSRCGSTLVTQMLAALSRNVVLSEATPIDALLRAGRVVPGLGEERQTAWLRGMVGALGRTRNEGESRLFVKLDSWHVRALPLLRRAFPDVPWIFLYREPVEVLVSHRRQRGAQTMPGALTPETLGLDLASAVAMEPDEYAAHLLESLCRAAREGLALGGGLLVHYRELPDAVADTVAAHFGVTWSEPERARMAEAAARDAKDPARRFAGERDSRQREATDALRALAERIVGPVYRELETLRCAQPSGGRATRPGRRTDPAPGAG